MYAVTVTAPQLRSRPLAFHACLSLDDARELAAIYRALGHPAERIHIEREKPATAATAA
jgi:hypothetical protein